MATTFSWLATALVFVGLDSIWLTQVSPHLYPQFIGEILTSKVDLLAAAAFYLLYITGIVVLAVGRARERESIAAALLFGAILGLVAYGSYDLTNQATLRVWDIRITLADMAWGAFATACAAVAGYVAASLARRRKPPRTATISPSRKANP